ncbi:hypothetical protein U0070_000685 [Myodes glareolus]|uniref:K Homology domain-containing protein n=1 Tax=Myodes glareolus TaxID=447135 RepID=A0AAW0IGB7_MYOGA
MSIAAKIDSIPHLNNSTPLVDPSVYGYGVQKRPLDDGVGNQLGALVHQRQAKRLLGQIVDRCRNGPGFHNDIDGNSTIQELLIPASKVGLVIGKGGETIKQLQQAREMVLEIIREKDQADFRDDGISPERAAQVMGPPDRCQHAAHIISELILTAQERDGLGGLAVARGRGRGRGDWSVGTPGSVQEITYTVPADKCGLVIGKGGENIKSINQQSGAHVELQRNPPPNTDPNLRIFTIRGAPQQIEVARHLIDEKVGGKSKAQGMPGPDAVKEACGMTGHSSSSHTSEHVPAGIDEQPDSSLPPALPPGPSGVTLATSPAGRFH